MSGRLEQQKVATRYAKALFEQAQADSKVDAVAEDLQALLLITQNVPEFMTFMANPVIRLSDKAAFIDEQVNGKVDGLVLNLLRLMLENNRVEALPALVERYQTLQNEQNNIVDATVITAVPLDSKLTSEMQHNLQVRYSVHQVNINNTVDPSILGGAVIRIFDQVIDGSYAGKLDALKKQVV
ncbi:MAG: F0F1 ATP synthase subunit delta [Vampirovibrio sp.]|nr:F0F1 ATP synthase subunit delta [Vampirovibrio sp.]